MPYQMVTPSSKMSTDEARRRWWREELKRRQQYEDPRRQAVLRPAEAFDDRRATAALRATCSIERQADELGRQSRTVARRIASSCAGWAKRPTAAEFYDAVRAEEPTDQQRSLIAMWVREATNAELLMAWMEEVYTDRELVAAIHRAGAVDINRKRNADLNRWAQDR